MDVDSGMYLFTALLSSMIIQEFLEQPPLIVLSDEPAPRCTLVRIPYSLVPGMDTTSVAYHKALSTLAKQVHDSHALVPCPAAALVTSFVISHLSTLSHSFLSSLLLISSVRLIVTL